MPQAPCARLRAAKPNASMIELAENSSGSSGSSCAVKSGLVCTSCPVRRVRTMNFQVQSVES